MTAVVDSQPPLRPEGEDHDFLPTSYSGAFQEILDAPTNGVAPEQYTGQGEDDLPRSPVRKVLKKGSSSHINGHARKNEGSMSQLMVENPQDRKSEQLTTIKYSHRNGESQTQRSDELLSGRRVGTKWERSQYEHSLP